MSMIPLHPEKGLDPHLCYCPHCGGESNSLTVGWLKKGEDYEGRTHYFNPGKHPRDKRGQRIPLYHVKDVEEYEKVPGDLCDACSKEVEEQAQAVREGGFYFKCQECHVQGAVKMSDRTKKLCVDVKRHAGVDMDEPAGLEFKDCTEHENWFPSKGTAVRDKSH